MQAANQAFALQNVSFDYASGFRALEHLSFSARRGERLSLLGASGCGKSTLLRLLAGLENPSLGTIIREEGEANSVGIVFQQATLMPWARVVDNVAVPLRLGGQAKREARALAEAALDMVGLIDAGQLYPGQLSGGMAMRVAIARALVGEPELLLMDEPFAALDEITRFRLNDLLLSLHAERGFTLVFVTHSVFESVYLGERVAIMDGPPGRIVESVEIERPVGTSSEWRYAPDYQAHCAKVSQSLRHADRPIIAAAAPR